MSRLRVYVAGPYSDDNILDVLRNIGTGIRVCEDLFSRGFAPFCPWLDHQYEFIRNHTKEEYYEASVAWLEASEAVYVIKLRPESIGTRKEIARAEELRIPVFFNIGFLTAWRDTKIW